MRYFAFLLALSAAFSANARADTPDWTVNAVLGDISWIDGTPTGASETERLGVHLRYVHALLTRRDVSALPMAAQLRRTELLGALAEYADAGRFPQRDADEYEGRRPKFIDARGVHCAVGYLIAASGYAPLAQAIARDENFAYVDEIRTPGLMAWATHHGFGADELAMIQPSYEPAPTEESTRARIEQAAEEIALVCGRLHPTVESFRIRVRGEDSGAIRVSARGRDPFVACFAERAQSVQRGGGAYDEQVHSYRFRMRIELRPPREVLRTRLSAMDLQPANTGCGPLPGEVPSWARVDVHVGRAGRKVYVRTAPRNVEVAQCLADYVYAQLHAFDGGVWNLQVRLPRPVGPAMSAERLELVTQNNVPSVATRCVEETGESVEHLEVTMSGVKDAPEFEVMVSAGSDLFQGCVRDAVRTLLLGQFRTRRPGSAPDAPAFFRIDADVSATMDFDVETPAARDARNQEAMERMEREMQRYH